MSTKREIEDYLNSESSTGKSKINVRYIVILITIVIVFTIYLILRCSRLHELDPEMSGLKLIIAAIKDFSLEFSYNEAGRSAGLLAGGIVGCVLLMTTYDKIVYAHYRGEDSHGREHFMSKKEINEYSKRMNLPLGKAEANDYSNLIFSEKIQFSTDTDITHLNNNVLVIGGPGTGKSWGLVKPNLLQGFGSYVVTDPAGELVKSTGKFFERNGYAVKVFNLNDMAHSDCFNPFVYANNEENALSMVDSLIYATRDEGKTSGDPFWEDSMRALLLALVFYVKSFCPASKQNFHQIADMLRGADTQEKGEKKKSALDIIFDDIRTKDQDHICVKYYDIFLKAGDKTAASILVTTAVKLAPFNLDPIADLTSTDNMDVSSIGDKPTVLYIIVPQGTKTSNSFLVNMLYTSIFSALYYHASNDMVMCPQGHLKYHVQFILDEFANIGVIPSFEAKLSTMRKYHMSCWIIIQATAQLKALYEKQFGTIIGDCSTIIYLGSNEQETMEFISKELGNRTIKTEDRSYSSQMNKGGSTSKSFKFSQLNLMDVAQIRRMDTHYCLVVIQGEYPIYDKKYSTPMHPNAKEMGDIRTGKDVYIFSRCNTKPKSITQYRNKKQRKDQEMSDKEIKSINKDDVGVNVGSAANVGKVDPAVAKQTGAYAPCGSNPQKAKYKTAKNFAVPH